MRQSATFTGKPTARRRTHRLLGLALILLTLALALPAGASAFVSLGGGSRPTRTPGTTAPLNAVAFADATHGWAVGDDGTILATTDGGSTWSAQRSGSTEPLLSVAFSDAGHGWAVGYGGVILATTNGGASWIRQHSGTSAQLSGVAFSGASRGWAVGASVDRSTYSVTGVILATTDGGANWIPQASGTDNWLYGVASTDVAHGWAVGTRQVGNFDGVDENGNWFGGAFFEDVILATTSGGTAWTPVFATPEESTGPALVAAAFPDDSHGWTVGWSDEMDAGVILATSDGGATWSAQRSGVRADLYGVAFPDAVHGWAVGYGGAILATADGGATWRRQTPPGISGIYPGSGRRGTLVSISGAGFGAQRAGGTVRFGGKPFTTYKSWTDEEIMCRVPRAAERGVVDVTVTTALGTSNAVDFRVKR